MTKNEQIMNIPKNLFPEGFTYRPYVLAEALYNAGYRKVERGEWILEREPDGTPHRFHCSLCDYDAFNVATNFCPNCGADMRKEDEWK